MDKKKENKALHMCGSVLSAYNKVFAVAAEKAAILPVTFLKY